MKTTFAKLTAAILALALTTGGCYAQAMGGSGSGGGRKQHQQKAEKPAAQTPKVDEKAYNAAIKRLPGQTFRSLAQCSLKVAVQITG